MRTAAALVLQSYRTHDVAPWIAQCLTGVQAWAAARGYGYEFVDDRLFELAPRGSASVAGPRACRRPIWRGSC